MFNNNCIKINVSGYWTLNKKKFLIERKSSARLFSYYKIQGNGLIRSVKPYTLHLAQGSIHITSQNMTLMQHLLLLDLSQGIPKYPWCPVNGFFKKERPGHQSATWKVIYFLRGPTVLQNPQSVLPHSLMQLQRRRWKMVLTQETIFYSAVHSGVMSLPHLSLEDKEDKEDKLHHFKNSLLSEHRCFQIGRRHQTLEYACLPPERNRAQNADPQVVLLHNIGNSMGTEGNTSKYDLTFYKVAR